METGDPDRFVSERDGAAALRLGQELFYDGNTTAPGFSQNAWGRPSQVDRAGASYTGSDGYGRSEQFSYMYSYTPGGLVTAKRLRIGKTTQTGFYPFSTTSVTDLDLNYTYDSEGHVATMKYPGAVDPYNPGSAAGKTFTYGFDGMRRPLSLTDNASPAVAWASNASYNAAGQTTFLSYTGLNETRQYNALGQLTRITTPGAMDMQYVYTPGLNNGQIAQAVDGVSGETISYVYDTLKRLIGASATGSNTWNVSTNMTGSAT